jgi:ribosomal protein S18 acetylase RimI-like enzyme
MSTIRKAIISDLEKVSILFDSYRVFYHKKSDLNGAKTFLKERFENKDSELFICELESELLGFVQLYPLFSSVRMKKFWLLNDLFVAVDFRGKGFSKKLIEEAKKLCIETNAAGMLLETSKSNKIGNILYPKCGFQLCDSENFYEWENK